MSLPESARPITELLCPAGDWDAMRAAVANGADAVYFGLSDFNARWRATNFTLEELPEVVRYLHAHNVRGYITFNTLIFSDELERAAEFATSIAAAGADAVIVQDVGLARLLSRLVPGLAVHASTQMTLTEPRGIAMIGQLGIARTILARELSVDDVRVIVENTSMPVEVFVHGALCVAYSGQCLTSEALGGRSANRGQCAQACRLPYQMMVDGVERDLGDRAYLLSPQDLAAYDVVPALVDLGVASLKIEGRLKNADYVAATARTYRAAVDAANARRAFELSADDRLDVEQSFSRGFSAGFLRGVNHQVLVAGRFPKKRGVLLGKVVTSTRRGVIVELADRPPATNDETSGAWQKAWTPPNVELGIGVVFDDGHPEQNEQGGRVYRVSPIDERELAGLGASHPYRSPAAARDPQQSRRLVEIEFGTGQLNLAAVSEGSLVWKTDDPAVRRRLAQSFSRDLVPRTVPIDFVLSGNIGGPLTLEVRDALGRAASAAWPGPLAQAIKHPLTSEVAAEQLGRLGGTPFGLGQVLLKTTDPVMVPKSVLNDLRRRAVEQLIENRATTIAPADARALEAMRADITRPGATPVSSLNNAEHASALTVLVRTLDQLHAVLAWQPADGLREPEWIYCDFEAPNRHREAVAAARAAGRRVALATLRILKPGEEPLLQQIGRLAPDAVLVRNLGAIDYYRQHFPQLRRLGDYSLNVANELTADWLHGLGLERLVPSYDLNWEQLSALVRRADPAWFELVAHQHMPMFHMEHCVFAAELSSGRDHRDCGRPCDVHQVDLRDRTGALLPLVPDVGCRNTVFNSAAQSAAEYIPRLLAQGVRQFRVELLRHTADEVGSLLTAYARLLANQDTGTEVWRRLRALNQLGVTRGTLEVLN